eukprot:TRINITY_DN17065_c0_g1_i1.p1 TRINITY_DN17065_c0_g1~~TRINITY_DN17065_c0_g1_i1.p1  ORF type:complete len:1001 (+),score=156.46 TRINITY_DN17065_c0_g1_i1:87-3005(+)
MSAALRAAAVVVCVAAAGVNASDMRWVLFRIGPEGVSVDASHVRATGGRVAAAQSSETPDWASISVAYSSEDGDYMEHFRDPRRQYTDWVEDGRFNGTRAHLPVSHFAAWLPTQVSSVTVHSEGRSARELSVMSVRSRRLSTLAAADPELITIQSVAPVQDTGNLVFLSGAYGPGNRSKFTADVNEAMRFLRGGRTQKHDTLSQPMNRYLSMLNVFAVWQQSDQDGAEHPDVNGRVAVPKPNPLKCQYGSNVKRMLHCDRAETLALATYAPAADWIVVLVNDVEYGGSACCGVTWLYTGGMMNQVLIHELGHAIGDASDEYDYGFTESSALPLKNCALDKSKPNWGAWLQTPPVPAEFSAMQVCSYTNYYRPTDQSCLMYKSSLPRMCPVCREAVIQGLFAARGVDLAAPICPMMDEQLVIRMQGTQVTQPGSINLNPDIRRYGLVSPFKDQDNVDNGKNQYGLALRVVWQLAGTTAPIGTDCTTLVISGSTDPTAKLSGDVAVCHWKPPATGDYTIRASVTDTADQCATCTGCDCDRWLRPDNGIPVQIKNFSVLVRSSTDTSGPSETTVDCNARHNSQLWPSPIPSSSLQTVCKFNGTCNITFKSNPKSVDEIIEEQKKEDGDDVLSSGWNMGDLSSSERLQLSILCMVGGAIVMGMFGACRKFCCKEDEEAHEWTECHRRLRAVTMFYFIVATWVAGAMTLVAGYLVFGNNELQSVGVALSVSLLVYGFLSFTISITGFGGAANRSAWMLAVVSFCVLLFLIFLCVAFVIIDRLADHARDTSVVVASESGQNVTEGAAEWERIDLDMFGWSFAWMDHLRDLWKSLVSSKPQVICSFQTDLKCSGFQKSCYDVMNSYCPADCKKGNRAVNPCVHYLQTELADSIDVVWIACVGSICVVAIGVVCAVTLLVSVCGVGKAEKGEKKPTFDRRAAGAQKPSFAQGTGSEMLLRTGGGGGQSGGKYQPVSQPDV